MVIFRKPLKPAHELVGEYNEHRQLRYRCVACKRTFFSAERAKARGEYCCGKRCYFEYNLAARRTLGAHADAIPAFLMQKGEIKAVGRAIRKGQEPMAYLHYELIDGQDYIPLYDVRECVELVGAVKLPELSE